MAACRYLLSALLVAVVSATVSAQGVFDWDAFKAYSDGNLNFTNALYKIKARKEGNFFFSPTIIHTVLTSASLEAKGPTAVQMAQGLYLPANHEQARDGMLLFLASFYEAFGDTPSKKANIESQLFRTISVPSPDTSLDDDTVARGKINGWVERKTETMIADLLPAGSLDINSSMILVNTQYFKDEWDGGYLGEAMLLERFLGSSDDTKDDSVLQQYFKVNALYYHSEELKADIFEIFYSGPRFSMIIILPSEENGLRDVETRLAELPLRNITSAVRRSTEMVRFSLPKFKLEERSGLDEDLTEMGMGHMLSEEAEITSDEFGPIPVPKVMYKAFIDVDDKGTKAAAGSAIGTSYAPSMNIDSETPFKANHPFIFMLVQTAKIVEDFDDVSTVMFMGRYARPN